MRAGDIRFLCVTRTPHVGIVTNVEAVHAEHAGTLDDIAGRSASSWKRCPPMAWRS